jgi:hypothetical protein
MQATLIECYGMLHSNYTKASTYPLNVKEESEPSSFTDSSLRTGSAPSSGSWYPVPE